MDAFMGIDLGTTSIKGLLYDAAGQCRAQISQKCSLRQTAAGAATEDPQEILSSTKTVLQKLLQKADEMHLKPISLSFSSANQSLLALNDQFQPLTDLLTWAETRPAQVTAALKTDPQVQNLYQRTGTPLHPMSLLSKICWLRQDHSHLFQQTKYFCGIKEFVIYQLFAAWQMDISTASCTGLFDVRRQCWEPTALKLAGITEQQLPPIVDSRLVFHSQPTSWTQTVNWNPAISIIQGPFDGAAANLGVGANQSFDLALTIGTSAAIRTISKRPVFDPKQSLFCYEVTKNQWLLGGPVNNGGIVLQWLLEKFFSVEAAAAKQDGRDPIEQLLNIIQTAPAGSNGLLFFPYLTGERAPLWNPAARGCFYGLNPAHAKNDLARAVIEGIGYNLRLVLQTISQLNGRPQRIIAAGGFARSEFWCQLLADIFNLPLVVPRQIEASCLGAIILGLQALNIQLDLNPLKGKVRSYQPNPQNVQIYQELFAIYTDLLPALDQNFAALSAFQLKHQTPRKD
ncbi:gluconokinase [Liquorilactobacillus sicerae]|uniref:gluconokinase n=1 Tax=Liquorilactobacillus sicerae TaxID=1416943 RepID=UPI00247FC4AA|nr:gluconokinase [Liquorilactobacillus sicerae]